MDYFSYPFHISTLKNHILKDPLCDWYNIQDFIGNTDYVKDKANHYNDFIMGDSNRYRNNLINDIKNKAGLKLNVDPSIYETVDLIKDNFPLILNGKLLFDKNMIVICDIIIRYDYFKKIFSKIENIPFHIYLDNNQYMLINISYSSINFKIDLKETYSDGILMYKKCCLYSFQKCMEKIINYNAKCFILGREYYYKKIQLPREEFIGFVLFDNKIKNKYRSAYEWIINLRNNYSKMSINPRPSCIELYPNMNYKESNWEKEKYKLANNIKEITLVWNISYEDRCDYLKKGIECWDDNTLLLHLKESKKKSIQERMIHMNKTNDILIYPRKTVSSGLNQVLKVENNIYFDVESFLSFDERYNFFDTTIKNDRPVLAIIGFIYNNNYYDYTIERFKLEEEEKIVLRFSEDLLKISKNMELNVYHWGNAENNYMKYIYNKYPSIKFPKLNLINILDYFRTEPIIVQGVFKFGLKSIGRALYKNKLIETTWNETDNGLDSMIQFKDICMKHTKKIPIKRYKEIKDIVDYNYIDCKVLEEIVNLLRKIYA